jgi:hypothetical protein
MFVLCGARPPKFGRSRFSLRKASATTRSRVEVAFPGARCNAGADLDRRRDKRDTPRTPHAVRTVVNGTKGSRIFRAALAHDRTGSVATSDRRRVPGDLPPRPDPLRWLARAQPSPRERARLRIPPLPVLEPIRRHQTALRLRLRSAWCGLAPLGPIPHLRSASGRRSLARRIHRPQALTADARCGRRDSNPHSLPTTRT